jgi:hypothetical protein
MSVVNAGERSTHDQPLRAGILVIAILPTKLNDEPVVYALHVRSRFFVVGVPNERIPSNRISRLACTCSRANGFLTHFL